MKKVISLVFPILLSLSGCLGLENRVITCSPNDKFVQAQEKKLHYKLIEGKDPTLFFVPGFTEDNRTYSKIMGNPLLEDYRKIVIDPWGSGKSDVLTKENKTKDVVKGIELVMGETRTNSALFVGQSRAGTIIPAYSQKHPEKVSGAILLSSYIDREHTKLNRASEIVKTPLIGETYLTLLKLFGNKKDVGKYLEMLVTNPSEELITNTHKLLKSRGGFNAYSMGIKHFHPEKLDLAEFYKNQPTRYIHGEKDCLIILKKPLPTTGNPSMRVLTDKKHMLTYEAPEIISKEIYNMVERIKELKN